MKLLLPTCLCLILYVPFLNAQSGTDAERLLALLPAGKHTASLFMPNLPQLTPEEMRITAKFSKYTAEHPDALKLDSSATDPQYMDKMLEKAGFTPEEIKIFYQMGEKSNTGIHTTSTDSFEIAHKDNIISFHGHGKLWQLDSLQIDLATGKAIFRSQDLPYIGKTAKADKDGPLPKVSDAYSYEYRSTPDTTMDLNHMMDNLVAYEVSVGRMDATGETVVTILAMKYANKRLVMNVMIPFLFK